MNDIEYTKQVRNHNLLSKLEAPKHGVADKLIAAITIILAILFTALVTFGRCVHEEWRKL